MSQKKPMRALTYRFTSLLACSTALCLACGGEDTNNNTNNSTNNGNAPSTYSFASRFEAGQSSVSHSGQAARHVLIHDLKAHIGGLTDRIDQGTLTPTTGDVMGELSFYFDFDSDTAGDTQHNLQTSPAPLQDTYDSVSSGKDLVGKLAGNDPTGQHKDWSLGVVGAGGTDPVTPEALVRRWFTRIDELAVARANGNIPDDPTGAPIPEVYVTPEGLDLQQLIQKFLDGAIAYSQGTDDYLDDDTDGKGLLTGNTEPDADGKPYTTLEHQWDEGFGYFGAAHDYAEYTDDEIAAASGRDGWSDGYHDTDGDGRIDLASEYNFGHSQNAAKRDRGSNTATDFTKQAIEGFTLGRHIIATADGELDDAQMTALKAARDQAVRGWENAIAATVVHYVNDTLQDMGTFGTAGYSFADHAKHWSELKGFALVLQFNPRSQLSDAEFMQLQTLIGDAPALPGDANVEAYKTALRDARALLGTAYGFASENLGDDNGEGGW